jgi:hypothetical protein
MRAVTAPDTLPKGGQLSPSLSLRGLRARYENALANLCARFHRLLDDDKHPPQLLQWPIPELKLNFERRPLLVDRHRNRCGEIFCLACHRARLPGVELQRRHAGFGYDTLNVFGALNGALVERSLWSAGARNFWEAPASRDAFRRGRVRQT